MSLPSYTVSISQWHRLLEEVKVLNPIHWTKKRNVMHAISFTLKK
jgi:hypothetical protein